ncbi:hypothetical protein [Olivibacter sitiensis]|uniref:hypothetical protein n=1 Tax=Olivibacter sitiensis TaxID=376470 RepID=UPI0004199408|nr:hypothetical protein [Olivibacter sitiensis]
MKKLFFVAVISIATLGWVSCNNGNSSSNADTDTLSADEPTVGERVDAVIDSVDKAGETAKSDIDSAATDAKGKIDKSLDKAKSDLKEAKDKVGEKTNEAVTDVKDAAKKTGDAAKTEFNKAKEGTENAAKKAEDKAKAVGKAIKE